MRYFLLDTNMLLAYFKADNSLIGKARTENNLDADDAVVMVSVVSIGEVRSIAFRNLWGERKVETLNTLLNQLISIDVTSANDALLAAYAEIDAYCRNRHPKKKYPGSARTMAKNDLWIAATAYAAGATLLTTDTDFDHLNSEFISVKRYDVK